MISYLILIVKYNNEKEVVEFLHSINQQINYLDISVSISCNDGNLINNLLLPKFRFKIIQHVSDNIGYLNGCFKAYKDYQYETNMIPDWLIICNTDIHFSSSDFFYNLSKLNLDNNTWLIAPSIYNKNKKTYDNPMYLSRITKLKFLISTIVHSNQITSNLYHKIASLKHRNLKSIKTKSRFIYSGHGSFIILKPFFYEYYNKNPYLGFLYGEEIYIGESLRVLGKNAWYESTIEIIHNESQSTKKLNRKLISRYFYNSYSFLYRSFYKKLK